MDERQWLRIRIPSVDAVGQLRASFGAEVLRGTLRDLDARSVCVDALVPHEVVPRLASTHEVRVLGDIEAMARDARRYAAKMSRYACR